MNYSSGVGGIRTNEEAPASPVLQTDAIVH